MTLEQRVANLESTMATLVDVVASQQRHLSALVDSVQRVVDVVAIQQQELAVHRQEVAEYRREARQMQRLWVHLARKYGWLEDDDWPPPEQPQGE